MGRTDGTRAAVTRVQDAFYPANDDVIKVYHSNISASRLAVWKGYNDPVIQTGWNFWEDHRDGISIEQSHVIHSRYKTNGEYGEDSLPSAILVGGLPCIRPEYHEAGSEQVAHLDHEGRGL